MIIIIIILINSQVHPTDRPSLIESNCSLGPNVLLAQVDKTLRLLVYGILLLLPLSLGLFGFVNFATRSRNLVCVFVYIYWLVFGMEAGAGTCAFGSRYFRPA
ncbi:hypothetical protein NC653_005942 [Populus alba x Populus x berolinensis]|uniref:Uncharacterized protein n=1 Tax=Populus alba x Populus x berolinensis TaxID=444605 RepID=A0AAD6RDJ9_9ROSI|nr:hypothetical protein NC653_005942 [Populus alba x Populus x berolinensis]